MLNPVDAAARFDASIPPYRGQFVKDADPAIIDDLAARGRLERVVDYEHAYPHCWRCDTPLIYWATPTWFARTADRRADLLRENETVGWHPEHIQHGRFGDWLENNVDWALSRDRFWGTPLPFWRCARGPRHLHRVAGRARRAGRPGPDRPRPAPSRRRRGHDRVRDVRRAGPAGRARPRRLVRLGVDAGRAVALPLRARRRVRAPLPRRLHLRGDRPDPRLVLLAARGQHARVRPHPVPQRRVPGPPRRQGRPEDVEVAGQRHRPLVDPRPAAAPTRCAGTSSPPARRGRTAESTSG